MSQTVSTCRKLSQIRDVPLVHKKPRENSLQPFVSQKRNSSTIKFANLGFRKFEKLRFRKLSQKMRSGCQFRYEAGSLSGGQPQCLPGCRVPDGMPARLPAAGRRAECQSRSRSGHWLTANFIDAWPKGAVRKGSSSGWPGRLRKACFERRNT